MKEDKTLKYISGSRRLTEKDISFSDEIIFNDEDGSLNFYMDACFDVDAVFGTHVCTDENDDFLNIYANYDIRSDKVCKDLVVILDRADGTNEPMAYELTDAECDMLRRKMEEYCKMPLPAYVEKFAANTLDVCVRMYNIQWDTDGEENTSLPEDVTHVFNVGFNNDGALREDELLDAASEWLSETYGFCHKGFELKILPVKAMIDVCPKNPAGVFDISAASTYVAYGESKETVPVEVTLKNAVEIEELDGIETAVEITYEEIGVYLDRDEFVMTPNVVRTNDPSQLIDWGDKTPDIFAIDRDKTTLNIEEV